VIAADEVMFRVWGMLIDRERSSGGRNFGLAWSVVSRRSRVPALATAKSGSKKSSQLGSAPDRKTNVKQSIPFFGINRRGLLSRLAVLPAFSGTLLAGSAQAETVPPGDALPSWNDGLAKQAIVACARMVNDWSPAGQCTRS
jgi:hypothetical protein